MGNLERMVYIDRRIREHGRVTVAQIVERFEVSDRQAKRDLEYLRNRLDAPLVWDRKLRAYVYERAWRGLNFADGKALLFFVFARAAAGTLAYVPLAESGPLDRLRELVPPAMRGLEGAVRYELPGYEPVDDENLALLLESIGGKRGIEARYRDLEGRETERILVPRRIVNYAGTWYCAAFDPSVRELRIFRLSRFVHMAQMAGHADPGPEDEEVDLLLNSSYGMFKGTAGKLARIRFRGKAREIVHGEFWHPEQSTVEGADAAGKWFEVSLPVSHWDEIVGRILRFGSEAEAVAPPEFRDRWLEAIDAMAKAARRIRDSQPMELPGSTLPEQLFE